ncbi:MAG: hypothetical protein M1832_001160 [Thelocarpon impressellum]|nr:MAG: hypothetical protein M1832_001160 [Thelocarpon impressellum]
MAAPNRFASYFANRSEADEIVVRDPPKFDLDAYIANYTGRTRLDRLLLIARSSPVLAVDALKAAHIEAKHGKDINRYIDVIDTFQHIAPEEPDSRPDTTWMDRITKQVKVETERLEFELKGYKNNLIKESIRMGNEDLGSHYHAIGDLPGAFKAFARMRDFCTSPKHVCEMCLKLVVVSVEQANWMVVQSNALKIRNLQLKPDDRAEVQPKVCAAMGLAQLASGNYLDAAVSFLLTDPTLANTFNQVLTPNDIAVYGGLCALASMDRTELQTRVLDNGSFRNFLELEPHIRRAIGYFCDSKYSQCLHILEAYRTDYLLDIHLQKHVSRLYENVRSKSIVQYFIPYSCVTLESMAKAFATTEEAIEAELIDMIEHGTLEARIDTQNRLLTARETDLRMAVHRDALQMARQYEKTARLRLMRMNIVTAGLDVKAPKGQPSLVSESQVDSYGHGKASWKSITGRF